jgi:periplasmic divalent cation tolerance protein
MDDRTDDVMMAYVTTSSRAEALKLGRALVEERLAACANVFDGMTSIYRWNGQLHEDEEAVLIVKTTSGMLDRLTARVRELHSYELPCVLAWKIAAGNPPYLDWMRGSAE